jgi:uncharacterized protein
MSIKKSIAYVSLLIVFLACIAISCKGNIKEKIVEGRYPEGSLNNPTENAKNELPGEPEKPGQPEVPFSYVKTPMNEPMVPIERGGLSSEQLLNASYDLYGFKYQSDGQGVPALLAMPKLGDAPFPVVIMLHGHRSSKAYMIYRYARGLALAGIASLAIDLPYEGDRKVEGKNFFTGDPQSTADNIRRAVIDARRGIDWLQGQQNINSGKLAIIGYSLGSWIAVMVTAADDRVDAVALNVMGVGESAAIAGSWPANDAKNPLVERLIPTPIIDWAAPQFEGLVTQRWIAQISPRPILMLNGKNDKIIDPANAQKLFDAAKEPKKLLWYDAGHILPAAATDDCVNWIQDELAPTNEAP